MKVFEIAGPVFSGPSADFAPKVEAPQEELTSAEDVVLSKNGEQAARELKLSDQEIELLKAVALGWADMSDLGDLERDIFEYWFGNNPEDFNPDLHGGGADPSDTIMDELESWFEDKDDDQKTFDAEFKAADDRIKRDALKDSQELADVKVYEAMIREHFNHPLLNKWIGDKWNQLKSTHKAAGERGDSSWQRYHKKRKENEKRKEDVKRKEDEEKGRAPYEESALGEDFARMLKLAGVEESHGLNLGPKHPHASTAAKGPGVRGVGYNDKYQWSGATDLSNLDPETQAIDAMDYSDSYDAGKVGNVDVSITPAGGRAFDKAMRKRGKWLDPAIDDRKKGN